MHINTELRIPENARVLEIGGGGFPHPRTSLILDKFLLEDGVHQRGEADLVIDRPFVHADACKMPFADKSFDYVIASHVIEHIPEAEIESFVREINRVGNAGYIEAPGPLYETLRDIPEHLWFVVCAGNTVHLAPKRREDIPPQKRLINPMFYDSGFSPILSRHSDIWHTGMEWLGSFRLQIHESLDELWEYYDEKELMDRIKQRVNSEKNKKKTRIFDPSFISKIKRSAVWRVAKLLKQSCINLAHKNRGNSQPQRSYLPWRDIVVCPNCMKKLSEHGNILECKACKTCFPILEGDIPCFVHPIQCKY